MRGCIVRGIGQGVLVAAGTAMIAVGLAAQAGADPDGSAAAHGGYNGRVDQTGHDYRSSTHSMPSFDNDRGTWRDPGYSKGPIIVARPQPTS